ncbi:HAD hydrolase-like protein [Caldibacillus lycopersici]|uniref:Nucleotidase n=1 Tax=Perspicuibacillus lycopersici TaxID=1325689 RepID=A0AAE3IVR0_9BACI|nr:HAD family acid phosphatase [Perspicuibacillus lycopersici]MCU9612960.1 HAD hydrolase-like protein [Perspicuibacillus lycopersici]
MKFGFDIDDTLINLREHAFHIYNKKLGKNIPIETFHQIDRVEIHEPFGLTDEQGNAMWNNTLEDIYYTFCPPFPDAVETLQALAKQGHEIYYITSRPKEHGERTKEWVKARGFPVEDDRFFYGMEDEEKVDFIKNLQLDYYFDDKPKVLNTLLKENTKVYVKDQPYNRNVSLPRIVHWNELKNIIGNGKQ